MIDTFLNAKHWQIFVIAFGIPVVFQTAIMGYMFGAMTNAPEPDPLVMLDFMKFYPLVILLYLGAIFGWFWSVSIGLQSQLPEGMKMRTKQFKFFLFIPLLYIIAILLGLIFAANYLTIDPTEPEFGLIFAGFAIIFPLHFFSMFCIFYLMYFSAKTIKSVELGRKATFSDFGGDFFLIWFFFIGIWFIQPRVNKLTAGRPGQQLF